MYKLNVRYVFTFAISYHHQNMGVSENVVYPIVPNGFADHYPVFKWLFHWEYTQHFQTNPYYKYKLYKLYKLDM